MVARESKVEMVEMVKMVQLVKGEKREIELPMVKTVKREIRVTQGIKEIQVGHVLNSSLLFFELKLVIFEFKLVKLVYFEL